MRVYGPEDWHPTFNDPDSGGDPYIMECECGLSFRTNTYDFEEAVRAWNEGAPELQSVLGQIKWERCRLKPAFKHLQELGQ